MRSTRAALHLLIAAVATFPLLASPLTRLIGHEDVDVWNHAWGPWWFWKNLVDGTAPWRTQLLAAPDGGVLWYIDPVGAVLGMGLVPLLGVVGAYNAVIFAEVALASVAGRRLANALGATEGASWLGAVGVACSPYVTSEVHNGVSEAVGVPWAVFALAAGRRAVDLGGARRWAAAGAWLALTAVGTWYYALGAGVILAVWTLGPRLSGPSAPPDPDGPRPGRRTLGGPSSPDTDAAAVRDGGAGAWTGLGARLGGLGVAVAVSLALAGPVLYLVHRSVTHPDSIVFRGEATGADREMLLSHNAVDPRAFLMPGDFQSVDLTALGEQFRHSSYVGLMLLALALYGRRGWALAGALPTAVLSLGTWLWWDGAWVDVGGARLALPFRWLLTVLPDSAATHAQRVGFPALAVVAAVAAVGASRLPLRAGAAAGVLAAADLLFAGPWPLARAPVVDTSLHAALGREPGRGMVLDLPGEVGATMATSRYLLYQTASGRPIPYRPDARAGTSTLLGAAAFQALALPSMYRPEHKAAVTKILAQNTDGIDLGFLTGRGVRWVVVHRELDRGAQGLDRVEAQLVAWFGAPEVRGDHAVWDTSRARPGRAALLR